jgi:hypothetical protein
MTHRLLSFFRGVDQLFKILMSQMLGIEWEDTTSQYDGFSCNCRNRQDEVALDPALQERLRTGKLVVTNELKQRRAAAESEHGFTPRAGAAASSLRAGGSRHDSTASGGGSGKGSATKMRIGGGDSSKLTNITEALIPQIPRYRNLNSADQDVDLELSDPYGRPYGQQARSSVHNSSTATGTVASNSGLFSTTRHSNTSPNRPGSGVANPLNNASRGAPSRDLFSIDNEDDGDRGYGGRYSDV